MWAAGLEFSKLWGDEVLAVFIDFVFARAFCGV
jgi:hypothetical protein